MSDKNIDLFPDIQIILYVPLCVYIYIHIYIYIYIHIYVIFKLKIYRKFPHIFSYAACLVSGGCKALFLVKLF